MGGLVFTCRTCKKNDFTSQQMKKERCLFSNNRGVCKACASKNESTSELLRRAQLNPEKYITCDDCDGIMKNTTGGRYNILRTNCRYCKSENIQRY